MKRMAGLVLLEMYMVKRSLQLCSECMVTAIGRYSRTRYTLVDLLGLGMFPLYLWICTSI